MLLPIRHQTEEAIFSHDLLADLCARYPEITVGRNGERLAKVLAIFGDVLGTRFMGPTSVTKTHKFVEDSIKQDLEGFMAALNVLSGEQRKKIEDLSV